MVDIREAVEREIVEVRQVTDEEQRAAIEREVNRREIASTLEAARVWEAREDGHYWVLTQGRMRIAERLGDGWFLPGMFGSLRSHGVDDVTVLSRRLEPLALMGVGRV